MNDSLVESRREAIMQGIWLWLLGLLNDSQIIPDAVSSQMHRRMCSAVRSTGSLQWVWEITASGVEVSYVPARSGEEEIFVQYHGEWVAALRDHACNPIALSAGDRSTVARDLLEGQSGPVNQEQVERILRRIFMHFHS